MQYLDHIIWAGKDLARLCSRFEELTGMKPRYGGTHASGLTHNALVPLGARCYLEILAPVRGPGPEDDDWCRLARDTMEPTIISYCLRSARPLTDLAVIAAQNGWANSVIAHNGRATPTGAQLQWQWLAPSTRFGRAFPFFIDWLDSPHPAESFHSTWPAARVQLRHFSVGHPQSDELARTLEGFSTPIDTHVADAVQFAVQIDTPMGVVWL